MTEHRSKLDYYLAQIAAQICRSNSTEPRKIKDKDFLIKFQTESSAAVMSPEQRLKRSKLFWKTIAAAGHNIKRKSTPKKAKK